MKKIYVILSILLLTSCSSFGIKEQLDEATSQAIEKVKKVQEEQVSEAEKQISEIITKQLGQANESIEKTIESAKTTIQKEVEKNIDLKIKKIEDDIKYSALLGLIGIVFGIIGLGTAIYCIRTKITKDYVRGKLHHTIYEDLDFENRIKTLSKGGEKIVSSQLSLTRRDVEKIVQDYLNKNGVNQSNLKNGVLDCVSSSANERKDSNVEDVRNQNQSYELFAANSSTMQLSDIQTSFQRGLSVYRLKLSSPDSNTAELTLCVEQADVKQRILINDSQFLSPICDVRKSTATPNSIHVKEQGMAMKDGDGWKVIRKILVEIK